MSVRASVFDECRSLYGYGLLPKQKKLMKDFLKNPCCRTWDKVCGIVIDVCSGITVLQAIINTSPEFPMITKICASDLNDATNEWTYIPTPFDVLKSVKNTMMFLEGNECL